MRSTLGCVALAFGCSSPNDGSAGGSSESGSDTGSGEITSTDSTGSLETSGPAGSSEGTSSSETGGDESTTSGGAGPYQCGEIVSADHPPFAAIERLATTSDEVRILVYGQSISEQQWWQQTRDWLQEQYPNGNLVMEEHARGGCSAQCLVGHEPWSEDGLQYNRLAEDVFSWRPDLVIFHVYGDHIDYGYIMTALTDGCAAFDGYESSSGQDVPEVHCTDEQLALAEGYTVPEVLVQSDHRWAQNYPLTCPDEPGPDTWDCFMNEAMIPAYVEAMDYTLQDNWNDWAEYIEANDIDPVTLTNGPDDVHLSAVGNQLMFEMTARHLCFAP